MASVGARTKEKMPNSKKSVEKCLKKIESVNCDNELQKSIMEISQVSGLSDSANFTRVKGPGKGEAKSKAKNGPVRYQKNLDMLESDDSENETCTKSSMSDDFVDDCQLVAEMRALCDGASYSNRTLEQNWRRDKTNEEATSESSKCPESEETKKVKSMREKFAKNVCITSLLKNQAERKKNVGDTKTCNINFARDADDPDFLYRLTNVTNEDIDFTVEHTGKLTNVGPKKYVVENTEDNDFNFVRKGKRGSDKSEKNDN